MVSDPKKRPGTKPKPETDVASVEIGAPKYGDQDYKARPIDREPNGSEVQHLVAVYARYRSIAKAAKIVNIAFERASKAISDAIKVNPALLSSGDPELFHGLTAQEIATESMLQAFKKLGKLDANKLIYTSKIAQQQADSYFKKYQEKGGAKAGDADAIRKRIKDREKEIERLRAKRGATASGAGESAGAGEADGADAALGVDAQ